MTKINIPTPDTFLLKAVNSESLNGTTKVAWDIKAPHTKQVHCFTAAINIGQYQSTAKLIFANTTNYISLVMWNNLLLN